MNQYWIISQHEPLICLWILIPDLHIDGVPVYFDCNEGTIWLTYVVYPQ